MRKIALVLSVALSFMIPWEGVVRVPDLGNGTKIMGFVLAVFWLLTILFTGRFRRPGPFQMIFFLFVLWNAMSIFWTINPHRSLVQLITWIQLLVLVFMWWDLYTTRTAIIAGLQAYILGAYVAIGSAFSNYSVGSTFYAHYDRYSSGQTNPDGFGFILALGIPVAWHLATSTGRNRITDLLRFANYFYVLVALIGIILSGTRTALIASAVGMMFGLISLTRLRLRTRLVIFLLFIGVVFVLLPFVQSLKSYQRFGTIGVEITQGDLHDRINIWREGFASFLKHPLLGVGSNMFTSVNSWSKAAHNSFLSVLVELGLVGLFLFGAMVTMAFAQALRRPKWESWFWITLLAVWTVGASTLSWEHRKATWLFLSLAVASATLTSEREEAMAPLQDDQRSILATSQT